MEHSEGPPADPSSISPYSTPLSSLSEGPSGEREILVKQGRQFVGATVGVLTVIQLGGLALFLTGAGQASSGCQSVFSLSLYWFLYRRSALARLIFIAVCGIATVGFLGSAFGTNGHSEGPTWTVVLATIPIGLALSFWLLPSVRAFYGVD